MSDREMPIDEALNILARIIAQKHLSILSKTKAITPSEIKVIDENMEEKTDVVN